MTDAGKKCQEIFATGLRNPFRFAFDPNAQGTRFFINNVGQGTWEEVEEGSRGANYGWNVCEGNHDNPKVARTAVCDQPPYTPPIHEYNHDTGCSSITGGAFVPNGLWPASYNDSYLYGDYVCGKIFKLTPDGSGGYVRTEFVTGLGTSSAIAIAFGPYEGARLSTTRPTASLTRMREYAASLTSATPTGHRTPSSRPTPPTVSCPWRWTSTGPKATTRTRATRLPTCGTSVMVPPRRRPLRRRATPTRPRAPTQPPCACATTTAPSPTRRRCVSPRATGRLLQR
jgi:hypothetical protein